MRSVMSSGFSLVPGVIFSLRLREDFLDTLYNFAEVSPPASLFAVLFFEVSEPDGSSDCMDPRLSRPSVSGDPDCVDFSGRGVSARKSSSLSLMLGEYRESSESPLSASNL
ncbi:hypothetical protein BOVATA_019330 [Babesia ovata]|uniref:Uncharacterized protein n=1 Tax=Babesia ovata TaxID=189622 RepID=A0A2H6KBS0_9APIC|nr:uncharacterized protein BOVATA_019330 [Babesia ovata]GBE60440.1 hypothetical protein BOVATA_019330 [Babesia ovata]